MTFLEEKNDLFSLNNYQDHIQLILNSKKTIYSAAYIKKYPKKIDWCEVSASATLDVLYEFEARIKWNYASLNKNLSDNLIRSHVNDVDWDYISFWCSLEIAKEFLDKVNLNYLSFNRNLNIEFIRKHQNILHWDKLSKWLPLDILLEFEGRIDLNTVFQNSNINKEFIIRYLSVCKWDDLFKWTSREFYESTKDKIYSENQYLNDYTFIEKIRNNMNNNSIIPWHSISLWGSIIMLEEFVDYLDWNIISYNENLTNEFIRAFQDRLNWDAISCWCNYDIILEFKDRINIMNALHNKNFEIDYYELFRSDSDTSSDPEIEMV